MIVKLIRSIWFKNDKEKYVFSGGEFISYGQTITGNSWWFLNSDSWFQAFSRQIKCYFPDQVNLNFIWIKTLKILQALKKSPT